jgi:hypothetical protein
MVRGKFVYHEVPHGVMMFPYLKYKEDAIQNYTMYDGGIYTVPLGVAKHLNSEVAYPTHVYKRNEKGQQETVVSEMMNRCSFQSLEFMDFK